SNREGANALRRMPISDGAAYPRRGLMPGVFMRFNDIFVAGGASWLPPREPIGQDRDESRGQDGAGYESASIADEAPPDMAVRAGRLALARSGVDPAEVSLLLHAYAWYQGLDLWTASSYIHRELLGGNRSAQAIDLNQQCAGGVSALQL